MKRIFSVILAIVLSFTVLTANGAENPVTTTTYVDGYLVSITDCGNGVKEYKCFDENGVEHKLLYDESEEVQEYSTTSGFWFLSKTTLYDFKITKFDQEGVACELSNKETGETTYVEDHEGDVVAQMALPASALILSGLAAAAKALLIAALKTAAKVVIAGAVYVLAREAAKSVRQTSPQNHYYQCLIKNGEIWMGKSLSQSLAASLLSCGQDVIALGDSYAMSACRLASPVKQYSEVQIGYSLNEPRYPHRHPMLGYKLQMKAHCFIF